MRIHKEDEHHMDTETPNFDTLQNGAKSVLIQLRKNVDEYENYR